MGFLGLFLTLLIIAVLCFWLGDKFSLLGDKLDGVDMKTTFDEMCQTANVVTVTAWLNETHATDDKGKRIRVPCGFPNLISIAARHGLYPTTCDLDSCSILTLVRKAA